MAIISSVSLLRKKGARKNPFALVNTYNLFHGRPGVSLQHIYMPWPNNKYSLISFFLTSQIFWSLSTHTPLRPAFVSLVFRKKSSTTARFKKRNVSWDRLAVRDSQSEPQPRVNFALDYRTRLGTIFFSFRARRHLGPPEPSCPSHIFLHFLLRSIRKSMSFANLAPWNSFSYGYTHRIWPDMRPCVDMTLT